MRESPGSCVYCRTQHSPLPRKSVPAGSARPPSVSADLPVWGISGAELLVVWPVWLLSCRAPCRWFLSVLGSLPAHTGRRRLPLRASVPPPASARGLLAVCAVCADGTRPSEPPKRGTPRVFPHFRCSCCRTPGCTGVRILGFSSRAGIAGPRGPRGSRIPVGLRRGLPLL